MRGEPSEAERQEAGALMTHAADGGLPAAIYLLGVMYDFALGWSGTFRRRSSSTGAPRNWACAPAWRGGGWR
ncbi:MAG: hypothetical protein WDN49_22045 [Acetobacteraceae bacterium]